LILIYNIRFCPANLAGLFHGLIFLFDYWNYFCKNIKFNMKITSILAILVMAMSFLSCSSNEEATPQPVANFSYNGNDLRAPVSLAFTNASKDGDTYSWNFGNGTTSNLKDPSVVYNEGGNYQVTLTVTGKGGTSTYSQTVIVKNKYTSVGVSEVAVLAFPALKPDGSNWDGSLQGTLPDVYFQVANPSNTSVIVPGNPDIRQQDLNPAQLPLTWSSQNGADIFAFNGISGSFNVQLFDYESIGADELMGFATFNLDDYTTLTNKYPLEVTKTNGQTSIRLKLNWQE
jgi:hypothetical protein